MSSVIEIPAGTHGMFTIQTETGTQFVLQLADDESTLTRKPGMTRPVHGDAEARQAGDFTALPLLGHSDIAVGHAASFSTADDDGEVALIETSRITSIVS